VGLGIGDHFRLVSDLDYAYRVGPYRLQNAGVAIAAELVTYPGLHAGLGFELGIVHADGRNTVDVPNTDFSLTDPYGVVFVRAGLDWPISPKFSFGGEAAIGALGRHGSPSGLTEGSLSAVALWML
jgi:hypothetical protein